MTLEICIDSYESALMAQKYQTKRVELCSALSVGGLTPSMALVKQCTALKDIEVHAMLRHREGDFVYSDQEIELLLEDLIHLANAGVKGVVFGCLTPEREIDMEKNRRLLEQAKRNGLEATFHRAFDLIHHPNNALEQLIDLGFDRLLTSGKKGKAIDGIDLIQKLVNWSKGRIEIMAGSGVDSTNAMKLAEVGVDALHFTSHQLSGDFSGMEMGQKSLSYENKIASVTKLFQ